ncbi:uncharacterized protein IUM83_19361 [Phytophthora cinnamomi]|uniref:uncharacterized protein n=1 Tax=Phytophthora cinnamomi TaxID=4785 RepID=UPI0035596AD1|nr:hypothetical protein IUM83_19361 [Phytophthora cinnamomi]
MPNSTQYESDGDVIMSAAHQPVFEFLHAPKLMGWSQDALVTWKKQREQYEECIRQRCVESGERPEHVQSAKNAQVPDLDAFFKRNLNVDMYEGDIDVRVLKFFREFSDLTEKNGLGDILGVGDPSKPGYSERMKLRCAIRIANMEPAVLRDEVCCHTKPTYHILTRDQKTKTSSEKKDRPNSDNLHGGDSKKSGARQAEPGGARSEGPPKRAEPKAKPPRTGCWHCKVAARGLKGQEGATSSFIPRQSLEELIELGADVEVRPLQNDEEVNGAGGAVIVCHESVKLDLRLQTVAGPVHLAEVVCIVLEGPEEAFILGNDMLVSLGIDVNAQLSQLAGGRVDEDQDPFEPVEPRAVSPCDVRNLLEAMVTAAGDNGFPPDYLPVLLDLVMEFEDVFRIELGNDPPANVEPLRITIRDGAQPYRTRPRRYAPAQSDFLQAHTQKLLDMGFISRNQQSHWACAAVLLPISLLQLAGQEIMSFVTDDAVFTPTRVPQVATDSAFHFHSQLQML